MTCCRCRTPRRRSTHVVERVRTVQDILGRRILLENVSSYVGVPRLAPHRVGVPCARSREHADCLILLDVNNIYVSAVNHEFDPLEYLQAIPAERVQQIHLAGHENHGDYLIDTHDHPVPDPVWELYAAALRRFGAVVHHDRARRQHPAARASCARSSSRRARVSARTLSRRRPPRAPGAPHERACAACREISRTTCCAATRAIEAHVVGTARVPVRRAWRSTATPTAAASPRRLRATSRRWRGCWREDFDSAGRRLRALPRFAVLLHPLLRERPRAVSRHACRLCAPHRCWLSWPAGNGP